MPWLCYFAAHVFIDRGRHAAYSLIFDSAEREARYSLPETRSAEVLQRKCIFGVARTSCNGALAETSIRNRDNDSTEHLIFSRRDCEEEIMARGRS